MMSSEFLIVNIAKRQYLDPRTFGESEKPSGFMKGLHSTAIALLVCDPGAYPTAINLGGSWFGDSIHAVYDTIPPDSLGIKTSNLSNPDRNLYEMAWEEFVDIGPEAIVMVCGWIENSADMLASRVVLQSQDGSKSLDEHLLWNLGNAALERRCSVLQIALNKFVGSDWEIQYIRAKTHFENMGLIER